MRPTRCVSVVLVSTLFCVSAAAQQVPTRDPQALAVLIKMGTATGWNQSNIPNDVLATGTVTRYQGDVQTVLGITLKVKGPLVYRAEVQGASALTGTIVNDQTAVVLTLTGARFIPRHAALSMRPRALPFYSDLIATGDPSVALHYAGTETVNGQLAHRVEISREPSPTDPLAFLRRQANHLTVWVSASTWLPAQIAYPRIAENNVTAVATYVRQYLEYTVVQGLAVPLRQEEFAGTTHVSTLRLSQVSFNVGLPASDFTVPDSAQ